MLTWRLVVVSVLTLGVLMAGSVPAVAPDAEAPALAPDAGEAPPAALDLVREAVTRLKAGDVPDSITVTHVTADGESVREAASLSALQQALADAETFLAQDSSIGDVPDPSEPSPVFRQKKKGGGTTHVPFYSECAPLRTVLVTHSPPDEPTTHVMTLNPSPARPTGVLGAPEACGHSMSALDTVYLNATSARASCGDCAQAYAQFWTASEVVDFTRVNTYDYIRHRGDGHFAEHVACWPDECLTVAEFAGTGATVEFFMSPPDPLPACVAGTITCEGYLEDEFEVHALKAVREFLGI